ncbi:MAG: RNA polymerase sigma factor, partial [Candidatus Aminicenantes bacterium]|nr:RNA polymerase sigma factor [Candidatus Aminicenantes bacterium]
MYNPFSESESENCTDEKLVILVLKGNREALEEIIQRHQNWIYNITLRMVMDPQDAEDVTQEVLIKIITKLSTFKGRSKFRTWVYRIVANHVINMKKKATEKKYVSYSVYGEMIDKVPDRDLPDQKALPVDLALVLEEIKMDCLLGMILCLSREQRLVFILGEIFGIGDSIGGEIMNVSKDNYRQRLSRARKKVFSFMKQKCGLVNQNNTCHCLQKSSALIEEKVVDPNKLRFTSNYKTEINSLIEKKYSHLKNFIDEKCRQLFREHPFYDSPDYV